MIKYEDIIKRVYQMLDDGESVENIEFTFDSDRVEDQRLLVRSIDYGILEADIIE